MSKLKPQYLVSTDSIGFFGRPDQFIKLWQEYFDNKTLDGVEVIAFKPQLRLEKLVFILKKNNIPVLSFHGKTGGEERLGLSSRIIMTLINMLILDINKITDNFPKVEFLSHTHYFEKKIIQQNILNQKPKKFWIENHSRGKEGVEDGIKEVLFYRRNNINALGMFDVYHYISQMKTKNILENWSTIVSQIKYFFKKKDTNSKRLFVGVHFPIGSRLGDSLPIDLMSNDMLKLFADKIIPLVERVVFENQQTLPGLFFSTSKMIEKQKARNIRIIERLKKTGIIK